MWQHRKVSSLTLDLRECLRGHETAVEYLMAISPFFDIIYTSLAVENLDAQFEGIVSPGEFSRAFLNQYESVSGCGTQQIPDWVLEHLDVIAMKTVNYVDRLLAFYKSQRPEAFKITVFDYERTGPAVVSVKIAERAGDQTDAIDQAIRVSEFHDIVTGLRGLIKQGAPLDERAVEPQPAPRGSTTPSTVAPQARRKRLPR